MTTKQQTTRFTKMHGLGNDFVVIDALAQPFFHSPSLIPQLANRHTGIGFDQLLLIEPSNRADFFCRIYNADGSEAEQCGNGLRCVARFIHEEGLQTSLNFQLETSAGVYPVSIKNYAEISVTMGSPEIQETLMELPLQSHKKNVLLTVLSVGNPHAIVNVPSIAQVRADQLGPEISSHILFPHGANVGFMEIVTPHHIRLRTYERGVGETFACGSNACAAAVAGIANGWLQHPVTVEFPHGALSIGWEGHQQTIRMTGPASRIFTGELRAVDISLADAEMFKPLKPLR